MSVSLPNVGLVELEDAETGERMMVDTADADVRMLFEKHMAREQRTLDDTLKITGRTRPSRYIQALDRLDCPIFPTTRAR